MGILYEKVLRPVMFSQDPEKAHDLASHGLSALGKLAGLCRIMERLNRPARIEPIELFGLRFPNAVGLAAGMDKNAEFWRAAAAFGFGHVEVGTVTAQKQPGNPQPRVFRYPKEEALINRMGFNNRGAQAVAESLKKSARGGRRIPLGVNIGKSKAVPLDRAIEDYLISFNALAEFADYFTINVSSPNTPELRQLQGQAHLPNLLRELKEAAQKRSKKLGGKPVPLLVKIAPDQSFRDIDGILQTVYDVGFDGIIATNTTVARPGPFASVDETGGLSGRPLHSRSLEIVNYIYRSTGGKLPIIGVGGICDVHAAGRMMDAGASLVQIYTGWIYRGPFFPREVASALSPRHSSWIW